jgi:hypothetical protein
MAGNKDVFHNARAGAGDTPVGDSAPLSDTPETNSAEGSSSTKLYPIKLPSGDLMHPQTHMILPENRSSAEWQGIEGASELAERPIQLRGSSGVDVTRGDEVISKRAVPPSRKGYRDLQREGRTSLRILADHVRGALAEHGKNGSDEVVGSLVTAGQHLNEANDHLQEANGHLTSRNDEQALQHISKGYEHLLAAHGELTQPHMTQQAATMNLPVGRDELQTNKGIAASEIANKGFKPLGKLSKKVQLGRTAAGLIDLTQPDIAMRITQLRRAVGTASRGNSGVTNIQPDAIEKLTRRRTPRFRKADQAKREAAGLPATENWEFGAENNPKTPETVPTISDPSKTSGIVGVSPQIGVPGKTTSESLSESVDELEKPTWKPGIKAEDAPEKDMVLSQEEIANRAAGEEKAAAGREGREVEDRIKRVKQKEFNKTVIKQTTKVKDGTAVRLIPTGEQARPVVVSPDRPASKDSIVLDEQGRTLDEKGQVRNEERTRRQAVRKQITENLRAAAEKASPVKAPKGMKAAPKKKPKSGK